MIINYKGTKNISFPQLFQSFSYTELTLMKERKLMTAGKNSYVSLFKHHYSVPKEYVGRRMTILYDTDTEEIYCGMKGQ